MSADPPGRNRLERLDHALVPALRRRARPVGRLLGLPGRALRRLDQWVAGGRLAHAVTAHRGLVAFLVVALAFGAVTVHAQRYPELREQARQAAAQAEQPLTAGSEDAATVPSGDEQVTADGVVGPVVGARVDPYLADRRDVLAEVPDEQTRAAVVSFDQFLTPQEAVGALGEEVTAHVVQYRLQERTPQPTELEVGEDGLGASLRTEVEALVAQAREEEDEVASVLESGVEDETFRADYEARRDELRALRNTLASDPSIAFAVVVTGTGEQLTEVADHGSVRLVDVAVAGAEVDDTAFFGVLPSDQDRFSFGRRL